VVRGVSKALGNIHPHEFQELIDQCGEEIKTVSHSATRTMSNVSQWFHWKNLTIVFFLSLLVTLSVGLYTNAEWPWEMHSTVIKQRNAGQALINAWDQLSQNDQERLENNMINHPTV
jgi:hypothetical protein